MDGRRGILIAVEGIDGSGKTTQVDLLRRALADKFSVVASKEPTDRKWGRVLRESAQSGRLSLEEETNAFLRDREQHVAELIEPALEAGKLVILDRYFYSTIAYQGARGKSVDELDEISRGMAPIPDIVFLLDLDPTVALSRIVEGRNETPNEFERADYLAQVRSIFNQLAEQHAEIARIDATHTVAEMREEIAQRVVDGPIKDRLCAAARVPDGLICTLDLPGDRDWAAVRKQLVA